LPQAEFALLEPELEHVVLEFKDVLQEPGEPIKHIWFPKRGVMSLLSHMNNGESVEVATVGRETAAGLSVVLGSPRIAQETVVQIPGEGHRLNVRVFDRDRDRLPVLNRLLLRAAAALVTQISQGSACNRLHPIESRCARWLLMTHDRVDDDRFPLTHEFLAQMLGVTRPSVTIAAGILQKAGLISYVRGWVDVLDRDGLEQTSCECYRIITDEFRRLINPDD
jgi:CRP-like cAMP-binding protein